MKPTHANLRVSGPPGGTVHIAPADGIVRSDPSRRAIAALCNPYAYPYTLILVYFWAAESIPGIRTGVS